MIARRAIPISPDKARLSRRRFISISGAAAGMALCPAAYGAGAFTASEDAGRHLRIWRGVALGADAMLQLNHPDPDKANRMIEACIAEVSRLERIFSLYREDLRSAGLIAKGGWMIPPSSLSNCSAGRMSSAGYRAARSTSRSSRSGNSMPRIFRRQPPTPPAHPRQPSRRRSGASGIKPLMSIPPASPLRGLAWASLSMASPKAISPTVSWTCCVSMGSTALSSTWARSAP